jgi:hypothetical protein
LSIGEWSVRDEIDEEPPAEIGDGVIGVEGTGITVKREKDGTGRKEDAALSASPIIGGTPEMMIPQLELRCERRRGNE